MTEQPDGQPLTVTSLAPIEGILVLSPRSATAAVSNVPAGSPPASLAIPGEIIYLPTAAGPSAGHVGAGQRLTIALASGGTLVLNGATLTFAILSPISAGASPRPT